MAGPKIRERSPTFDDHYGQASLFWNSQTPIEKEHISKALQFELSKVETRDVRIRMLDHLQKINQMLAETVAKAIGENYGGEPSRRSRRALPTLPTEMRNLADATTPTTASGGPAHDQRPEHASGSTHTGEGPQGRDPRGPGS